jgi:hypothetical protein
LIENNSQKACGFNCLNVNCGMFNKLRIEKMENKTQLQQDRIQIINGMINGKIVLFAEDAMIPKQDIIRQYKNMLRTLYGEKLITKVMNN